MPISSFEPSTLSGLNSTEQVTTWQMKSVEMLSRCWCDFQRTPIFASYNVTEWEIDSIREAIESYQIQNPTKDESPESPVVDASVVENEGRETSWPLFTGLAVNKWMSWGTRQKSSEPSSPPSTQGKSQPNPTDSSRGSKTPTPNEAQEQVQQIAQHTVTTRQPWLRRKYDLRTIGIDLIIDFGWRRE